MAITAPLQKSTANAAGFPLWRTGSFAAGLVMLWLPWHRLSRNSSIWVFGFLTFLIPPLLLLARQLQGGSAIQPSNTL